MTIAMAGFAVEDVLIKFAAATLPLGQLLILFGIGGAAVFATFTLKSGDTLWHADVLSRPMRWRFFYELVGRLFYFLAIALIPLSLATVILQAAPIVVVAGAALFFNERVGWIRWGSVVIGLVGVIIIIQPGTDGFSPLALVAVIGMLGFAARDLASRAAPRTISTSLLGFYGFLTIAIAGTGYSIWEGASFIGLDAKTSAMVISAIAAGVAAYFSLMKAMRTGEISVVAPFRYTRLVFGVLLGLILLGEQLTPNVVFGALLIVGAGLLANVRHQNSNSSKP